MSLSPLDSNREAGSRRREHDLFVICGAHCVHRCVVKIAVSTESCSSGPPPSTPNL